MLLFAMYISPMSNIVAAHSLHYHQYTDDTQLYMAVHVDFNFKSVSMCIEDADRWFLGNGLLLNPEAVLFGIRFQSENI